MVQVQTELPAGPITAQITAGGEIIRQVRSITNTYWEVYELVVALTIFRCEKFSSLIELQTFFSD